MCAYDSDYCYYYCTSSMFSPNRNFSGGHHHRHHHHQSFIYSLHVGKRPNDECFHTIQLRITRINDEPCILCNSIQHIPYITIHSTSTTSPAAAKLGYQLLLNFYPIRIHFNDYCCSTVVINRFFVNCTKLHVTIIFIFHMAP